MEKQKNVVDQLTSTRILLDSIESDKQLVANGLKTITNHIHSQFSIVRNALEVKMEKIVEAVRLDCYSKTQVLLKRESEVNKVVTKADMVSII